MRGTEVSRTEAFADGVFGFGLTLLAVSSSSAPQTFAQVIAALQGFIPFSLCFAMFYGIWSRHYTYCRRYGLEDIKVRVLTATMLLVVLAYLYPLRFLTTLFVANVLRLPIGDNKIAISHGRDGFNEVCQLFTVYGIGFTAVQFIFYMLYLHAYKNRVKLSLDELETLDTKWWTIEQASFLTIPLLSISIVLWAPPQFIGWAGWVYVLMGLVGWIHGTMHGKAHRAVVEKMEAEGRLDATDLTDEDEVIEVTGE